MDTVNYIKSGKILWTLLNLKVGNWTFFWSFLKKFDDLSACMRYTKLHFWTLWTLLWPLLPTFWTLLKIAETLDFTGLAGCCGHFAHFFYPIQCDKKNYKYINKCEKKWPNVHKLIFRHFLLQNFVYL